MAVGREKLPGAATTELSLLTGHFLWVMGMTRVSRERMEGISGEGGEEHRPLMEERRGSALPAASAPGGSTGEQQALTPRCAVMAVPQAGPPECRASCKQGPPTPPPQKILQLAKLGANV